MGRKTTLRAFLTTNKQHLTRQNLVVIKKRKFSEINRISHNSRTKQRHKNQLYQSQNRLEPKNNKCRFCGDRDETINHVISQCSKLAQKEYKTRHGYVGEVIHWEMCKKFKFDHTNKWYMHNPATVLENDTYKLLWDFDSQTDHLISAWRPDLIIINKKERICKIVDFVVPADYRIKLKESEKKDKFLDFAWELKKLWNKKVTIIPIVIGVFGIVTK